MPVPGEQHNAIANPFEEAKPRISEFTATEIATLQSRLEKQLGPEYISARSGPSGQKVHYIAAEKCIALANEVFGFNGWSSSIQNIQVDFVDENPQTMKISLGLSVIVRVTLRDGTYHEDIGYGHIENCKGKAAAFEKAKKEGTTDGLKRALRNFGNVLGNCIYDKDYLAKVTKLKVAPTKFSEVNLHRHSDFAKKEPQVKSETSESTKAAPASLVPNDTVDSLDDVFDDDLDMTDFGVTEDGHPDEVVLPAPHGTTRPQTGSSGPGSESSKTSTNSAASGMQPPPRAPIVRGGSNGQVPARQQPQTPNQATSRLGPNQSRSNPQNHSRPQQSNGGVSTAAQLAATNGRTNTTPGADSIGASGGPVAFFSARSVKALPEDAPPGSQTLPNNGGRLFDPKLDSPSIRKTPGIDHGSTKPVSRDGRHVAPVKHDENADQRSKTPPVAVGRQSIGNVVNPTLNQTRQIGAPGGHSPMGNRGQYRPLTVKRPAPTGSDGVVRPALNEMTTNTNIGGAAEGTDTKRQKMA